MPRKTKEQKALEEKISNLSTKKDLKTEKEPTKTKTTAKTVAKKAAEKKEIKSTTKKKTETNKKTSTKKASTATKSKKTSTKKSVSKSKASVTKKTPITVLEYYDLPYRYNQTVVKILSQTPETLFVYWDISDNDRKSFEKQFGDDFFYNSKPILLITNTTMNYTYEIEINDFANSWYLNIPDSYCNYSIKLGRRPIKEIENLTTDYIHITESNNLQMPNDRVLFNTKNSVSFKNIKTGDYISKDMSSLSFMINIGKLFNIYDVYTQIYKKENLFEIHKTKNLSNPSSHSFIKEIK